MHKRTTAPIRVYIEKDQSAFSNASDAREHRALHVYILDLSTEKPRRKWNSDFRNHIHDDSVRSDRHNDGEHLEQVGIHLRSGASRATGDASTHRQSEESEKAAKMWFASRRATRVKVSNAVGRRTVHSKRKSSCPTCLCSVGC